MKHVGYVDPVCVPDVFASEMADAENLGGGVYRFTFVTSQNGERVVVGRVLLPIGAIPSAIAIATQLLGLSVPSINEWRSALN